MNNPKISVITVCFNAVETIEKTILSVINQTYSNIEYIIIDGASKDGTLDVINKYRDKIACFVSEPDKGIYDAMNKATKLAHGDFLFFLNSGDVFYADNTLALISSKLSVPNVIYYGDVIRVPQNLRCGGRFDKRRLVSTNICHQSIFYPNIVFEKNKYDTRYRVYADWILNMNCMGREKWYFQYLDQVISIYDTEGFSSSHKDVLFFKKRACIIIRYLGINVFFYAVMKRVFFHLSSFSQKWIMHKSLNSLW